MACGYTICGGRSDENTPMVDISRDRTVRRILIAGFTPSLELGTQRVFLQAGDDGKCVQRLRLCREHFATVRDHSVHHKL